MNVSLHVLLLSLVLFTGVILNRFSKFLKMPILLCFLAVGTICGKHGLDLFPLVKMANVRIFGEIALCFIMFTGGLQTSFRAIRSVFVTGTILSTAGVMLTSLLAGTFAYIFSNNMAIFYSPTFAMCILAGAVMSSTDSAAVFAILRGQGMAIKPKLQNLLEYESGSNDPAAFLLTSIMLSVVVSEKTFSLLGITWHVISGIVWGLGAGGVIGFLVGIMGQWLYNWVQSFLEYNGLRMVIAVAIVLFCYGITDAVFHANILMASYAAGVTMGNLRFNFKQIFIRIHDGLSWLMQIMLFTFLGYFFDYHMLLSFRNMLGALLLSLFLMFVARPLVVTFCMIGSPFSMRERIFTGWVGIRGSAPIMLAAMVVALLPADLGVPKSNFFYLIFTVVLFSILLQGSSIMWVAKKLDLMEPCKQQPESLLNYDERADGTEMHAFTISESNPLIGQNLFESDLHRSPCILLMVRRGRKTIPQTPDLCLQEGDVLNFLGHQNAMRELHGKYFFDEEYTSSPTLRQMWDDFLKKSVSSVRRSSRRKHRC